MFLLFPLFILFPFFPLFSLFPSFLFYDVSIFYGVSFFRVGELLPVLLHPFIQLPLYTFFPTHILPVFLSGMMTSPSPLTSLTSAGYCQRYQTLLESAIIVVEDLIVPQFERQILICQRTLESQSAILTAGLVLHFSPVSLR